jgi:hypothetical protein
MHPAKTAHTIVCAALMAFRAGDVTSVGSRSRIMEGVEKRIDFIATAIQFRGTVDDLAEAELCYAPQFGAANDPVNLAGMLAENVLNGDMPVADWLGLDRADALLLDVREPDEFASGHTPNAINLPLSQHARALRRTADESGDPDLLRCGTAGSFRHPVPDAARISIAKICRESIRRP